MSIIKEHQIELNTIQGAKDLISKDGFYTTEYLVYTVAVARKCKAFASIVGLSEEETRTLAIAAYLHNIGRFLEPANSNLHQHNAYFSLKEMGWNEDICLLVVHHLDSPGLVKLIAPTFSSKEYLEPLPERLEVLNQILTLSSLITGPNGEAVTLKERIDIGIRRYHENHLRVKHLKNLTTKAEEWLSELFVDKSV